MAVAISIYIDRAAALWQAAASSSFSLLLVDDADLTHDAMYRLYKGSFTNRNTIVWAAKAKIEPLILGRIFDFASSLPQLIVIAFY